MKALILASTVWAVAAAVSLSAQDELEATLRSMSVDENSLMEQLKSARSLMTAEFWKAIKDPARPGARERDPAAEAKAQAEGIELLNDVEGMVGLSERVLVELYKLRQLQYSKVTNDTIRYEEYLQKLIALPNSPPDEARNAEAGLAALGSPWRVLQDYYVQVLPDELIQRRKEAYEAYVLKKIEGSDLSKNQDMAGDYNDLGQAYWADGRNDEAEKYFLEVARQKDVPGSTVSAGHIGDAMMFLASIELRRGNREKALQYCKDLLEKNYPNLEDSRSYYSTPGLHAANAVRHWKDDYTPDLDSLKLPYFTDCKPYPSPQEPEYTDTFIPLTSVRFEGGADFPKDHPVFRLIGVKFQRYGIAVTDQAPFTIRVNTARHPETPERPQGYYLEISDREAVISGHDYQGTVWGVVSFIQCVDGKQRKARGCKVRDWPATLRRGHSGYNSDLIEFGLFNKLNFFFNQSYYFLDAGLPDKEVIYENLKHMARPFADFGLDFYVADRTPMFPKLSLTSERTFRYHLERHMKLAGYGANITMILDDCRYPLNEIDAKADGGKGWRIDNQYVQRLYSAVKERYPGVKMVFCPPYYWGPHWKDQYIDSRADYFKGIRDYLDPAIAVFWSGNQVLGYEKTPEQVKWFRDSANRKPMVWQNGMGPHIRMNYGCEVINWTAWHYPGFFENDCEGYMANADFPRTGFALAHMADALWRPEVYRESGKNREYSLQRAAEQLCGEGVYEALRPGTHKLTRTDRYLWGNGIVLNQFLFEESREEVEEVIEIAEQAMEKAVAINPLAAQYSSHYDAPVRLMRSLLDQFDNPRSFYDLPEYKAPLGANFKLAEQEVKLNRHADIFANAFDFHIGKPVVTDGRLCVQSFPNSPSRKLVWTFDTLEELPSEYDLIIRGRLGQDKPLKPLVRIVLNKAILHDGPAPFADDEWTSATFDVPWGALFPKGNTLTIENVSPREKWSEPLTFYLNYAIIKTKGKAGAEEDGLLPLNLMD